MRLVGKYRLVMAIMDKVDLDFLELFIQSFAVVAPDTIAVIVRADNKTFAYVTPGFQHILNYDKNIEGYRLRELPIKAAEFAPEHLVISNKVIANKSSIKMLLAHDFDNSGNIGAKIVTRKPIINPLTQNVVGLLDQFEDFNVNSNFAHLLFFVNKIHRENNLCLVGADIPGVKLGKRQHEILFLLLIGKSPKEIADFIIHFENSIISPATISAIINKQLYPKFEVSSTSQLIEKAILLGFANSIPESFIAKQGILVSLE